VVVLSPLLKTLFTAVDFSFFAIIYSFQVGTTLYEKRQVRYSESAYTKNEKGDLIWQEKTTAHFKTEKCAIVISY